MNLFKIKFKIRKRRVKHGRFVIDFAIYRLFPEWLPLRVFDEYIYEKTGKGWHQLHITQQEADELISRIKTYDDLVTFELEMSKKEFDAVTSRREKYLKTINYGTANS